MRTRHDDARTIAIADHLSYSFTECIYDLLTRSFNSVTLDGRSYDIHVTKMETRPYCLEAGTEQFDVILHRAHRAPHLTHLIAAMPPGTYLLNDLGSVFSHTKNTTYILAQRIGLRVPRTWAVPPLTYPDLLGSDSFDPRSYFSEHDEFSIEEVADAVGLPAYVKPQDGRCGDGVKRVEDLHELHAAYKLIGHLPTNLQAAVDGSPYLRALNVGPQALVIPFDAQAATPHGRYPGRPAEERAGAGELASQLWEAATAACALSALFDWDFNSTEVVFDGDGRGYLIDFANSYPDCSVISLHKFFPTLVAMMVRWLLYCAVTRRRAAGGGVPSRDAFYASNGAGGSYEDNLRRLSDLAKRHHDKDRFDQFCAENSDVMVTGFSDFFSGPSYDRILVETVRRSSRDKQCDVAVDLYRDLHRGWDEVFAAL